MSQNTGKTTPISAKVASSTEKSVPAVKPSESSVSKQAVPAVQSDEQPLGVQSAANVENPGRETPLVETEEDRTKRQMAKAPADLEQAQAEELASRNSVNQDDEDADDDDDSPWFGNEDKKELVEIPGSFKKDIDGYVIVHQQRELRIEGGGLTKGDHPIKIQAYNEQVFNKMIAPNADGMNAFKQQGIIITVLHDARSAKSKKNFKI